MDTKGRSIRGKIMRYDAKKNVVTIQRDNRQQATIPLTMLSEKDQDYVRQWDFNKVFLSASSFKIEAKRKKMKDGDGGYSGYNSAKKVENYGYEVTLQNRSTSTLENLELEYCIYYEQEEYKRGGEARKEGVRYGKLDVGTLLPKSERELVTKPVTIYTEELDSDWYYGSGADNKQSGKVRGIWVQVHMVLDDGKKISRNFCLPDSLSGKMAWAKSSRAVGMNSSKD